jgi:formyl-CoA transferase
VWEATEFFATGDPPAALGSAHRLSAPYQAVRAADGHLTVAALTPAHWEQLCRVLDRPDLLLDRRFRTNADRLAHRDVLAAELEAALAARRVDEWVAALLEAGVPAGPINDYEAVFDDPHTEARRMVETVRHPVEGPVRTLGFPIKMSGTPPAIRRPPPLLGQHTREVLDALQTGNDPWEHAAMT